jgi:hypothetical protein
MRRVGTGQGHAAGRDELVEDQMTGADREAAIIVDDQQPS